MAPPDEGLELAEQTETSEKAPVRKSHRKQKSYP